MHMDLITNNFTISDVHTSKYIRTHNYVVMLQLAMYMYNSYISTKSNLYITPSIYFIYKINVIDVA